MKGDRSTAGDRSEGYLDRARPARMDRGSIREAVRERVAAAPDRWFTVNSLAGELESSDRIEADRRAVTVAVERALSDLVAAGVAEREGSTYRFRGPDREA
jgi:hypothetical protein